MLSYTNLIFPFCFPFTQYGKWALDFTIPPEYLSVTCNLDYFTAQPNPKSFVKKLNNTMQILGGPCLLRLSIVKTIYLLYASRLNSISFSQSLW